MKSKLKKKLAKLEIRKVIFVDILTLLLFTKYMKFQQKEISFLLKKSVLNITFTFFIFRMNYSFLSYSLFFPPATILSIHKDKTNQTA